MLQRSARREADGSERPRAARERLEATVSGLGELELLRRRQEELVRAVLREEEEEEQEREEEEEERRREVQLSSEEKLLEENILLLRKQLNCLRRRDTGLINQLQELDRQISDLRLDTERSHDPPETDSRPSSGFYELSDGALGSLSNSSNSVFSECFCSTTETDGRLLSTDELVSCLDCDGLIGGFCDDSAFCGTVRRSLSAPQPPTIDPAPPDSQSKFQCDLVAPNGSEVYRYPSPLHAVAVQSPVFLQKVSPDAVSREEEGGALKIDCVPQSSSWTAPSSSSLTQKRLDGYILGLLQRRAPPPRTNRPRTSISAEASKSVLRPALCGRQLSAPCPGGGALWGAELRQPRLPGGGGGAMISSPQRTVELQSPRLSFENAPDHLLRDCPLLVVSHIDSSPLLQPVQRLLPPSDTPPKDQRELGRPKDNSAPKETKAPCAPLEESQLLRPPPNITQTPLAPPTSPPSMQTGCTETSVSGNNDIFAFIDTGGRGINDDTKATPPQQQNVRLSQTGNATGAVGAINAVGAVRAKSAGLQTSQTAEYSEPSSRRRGEGPHLRSGTKKTRLSEDKGSAHIRASRRAAGGVKGLTPSRIKHLPAPIPEGRVLDRHTPDSPRDHHHNNHHHRHRHHGNHHHGNHHHSANRHHHGHHHHGRDPVVVVAKPKYKRSVYRRLRTTAELPYDEALRRAQRRQRKELLSHCNRFFSAERPMNSPYSAYMAGSDSEYSAECASLFHSTIADTSEDERSNYTANRFGDSESSGDEYVDESAATSDTEESGGGGAGRGWSHLEAAGGRATGQEVTSAQTDAFVKIKASHTLKKKILRFRGGSLKLMTTV
ncbi:dapper homolog 1 [Cheilinus undulatus]|uniref:dapper homolog 1 n=1 Tax=Cheilinus undulatus TaxID=241271 RepID=UPI001BD535BE|nr:dapper homolog 1 [Cheilinus undulatus]